MLTRSCVLGCCLAAVNEKEELLLYALDESEQGTARWEYRGKKTSGSDICCIKSFDFYDTPNGQSRFFALMETGELVEIDTENSNSDSATGLVIHKVLPKPVAPVKKSFDSDEFSREKVYVLALLHH